MFTTPLLNSDNILRSLFSLHPAVVCREFSSPYMNAGHATDSADGGMLLDWASAFNLSCLYDPKQLHTFYLNPLGHRVIIKSCFHLFGCSIFHLSAWKLSLENYPHSHHHPFNSDSRAKDHSGCSIHIQEMDVSVCQLALLQRRTDSLLRVRESWFVADEMNLAYMVFCEILLTVARKSISCGRAYISC